MKFTIPPWIARMNARERMLAGAVGLAVFVFFNLFLWSWILGAISRGRTDLAARQTARKEQAILLKEKDLWAKRQEWIQQHQPVSKGATEPSNLLESQIKPVATKYNILLENPQIGTGESAANRQSVWTSVDTKSPWDPLVHFLYDVQQPEAFIVFESVNLAIDPNDQTQMKGKFKIARWFAPKKG